MAFGIPRQPRRRVPPRLFTGQSGTDPYRLAGPKPVIPKPAAPAQPATPATPVKRDPVTGLPVDQLYTSTVGGLNKNLATTNSDLTDQLNQAGLGYGVKFAMNDDGTIGDLGIDPNVDVTNPFSRAALLKRAFEQRQRGNTNSMAASGHLYSGALQNAQDATGFDFQQGQDSLIKGFQDIAQQVLAGRRGAQTNYDTGVIQAGGDLLNRQAEKPPVGDTPKDYVDIPGKSRSGVKGVWRIHNDGRKVFLRR